MGYIYEEERLTTGEVPDPFHAKYPVAVTWLLGGSWAAGVRRGPVVRLVRSLNTIREGVQDRHIARYIVGYIAWAGKHKVDSEVARLLRMGHEQLARELAGFWHELVKYTLAEIREKPELHGQCRGGA